MPSSWIARYAAKDGGTRWRVGYRVGGRETSAQHGGSFATQREARIRRDWIAGELAAMRLPDLRLVEAPSSAPTLREQAARWKASRVDVSPGTIQTYVVAIGRLDKRLGEVALDELDAQAVADLVAELHADGLKKQTIRKTVSVLAMILDHAGVQPNPARDKLTVKLPREERAARRSRRPARTSRPSCGSSPLATGCPRSCSMRAE